jgi:hypothetical protein
MKQNNLIIRTKEALGEKNIFKVIRDGIKLAIEYSYYNIFKSKENFKFREKKYNYFYYPYNATWRNERAIEIPIIWDIVKKYEGKNILELGNVLSHYFSVNYDILDKYEKAKGVINKDIIDFKSEKKYDLIVAISTLEHIGWDEKPKDPTKVLKSIKKLKKMLAEDGKIIATIPWGYNLKIDEFFIKNKVPFTESFFLKRISKDNRWVETDLENIKNSKYDFPYPKANALLVGIIKKTK